MQVGGAQGWRDGQMMLTVLLLNVIGHERVSDVDALEADRSLCRLVRDYEPEILGGVPAVLAADPGTGRLSGERSPARQGTEASKIILSPSRLDTKSDHITLFGSKISWHGPPTGKNPSKSP